MLGAFLVFFVGSACSGFFRFACSCWGVVGDWWACWGYVAGRRWAFSCFCCGLSVVGGWVGCFSFDCSAVFGFEVAGGLVAVGCFWGFACSVSGCLSGCCCSDIR